MQEEWVKPSLTNFGATTPNQQRQQRKWDNHPKSVRGVRGGDNIDSGLLWMGGSGRLFGVGRQHSSRFAGIFPASVRCYMAQDRWEGRFLEHHHDSISLSSFGINVQWWGGQGLQNKDLWSIILPPKHEVWKKTKASQITTEFTQCWEP